MDTADMGFTYYLNRKHPNSLVALLFLPHVLLQVSGFGFHIPKTRHPDGNRIWPQYRPEALIFFGRCTALLSLAWYRKVQSHNRRLRPTDGEETCHSAIALCIVLITMVAADAVAERYRKLGLASKTIRGLSAPVSLRYLMSAAQFHATLHSLLTTDTLSVQMAALTVVQSSAFGMTLRRKGIITQPQGVSLYALVLVMGMAVIVRDLASRQILHLAIAVGNTAALLRFEAGVNKYCLWCAVAAILRWASVGNRERAGLGIGVGMDNKTWVIVSLGSSVLLLLGAAKRQFFCSEQGK